MKSLTDAVTRVKVYSETFHQSTWAIVEAPSIGYFVLSEKALDFIADGVLVSLWEKGTQVA